MGDCRDVIVAIHPESTAIARLFQHRLRLIRRRQSLAEHPGYKKNAEPSAEATRGPMSRRLDIQSLPLATVWVSAIMVPPVLLAGTAFWLLVKNPKLI